MENKLKEQLRLRMLGQLSDEATEVDINNAYDVAVDFSLSVLSFLRETRINRETFEELIGFDLDLRGTHNWTLSEIRKLELMMNKKLL